MHSLLCTAFAVGAFALRALAQPAPAPANLDLELGAPGEAPSGWFVPVGKATLLAESPQAGKHCAALSNGGRGGGMANLMQSFDAAPFRGKKVAFSAFVRLSPVEGSARGADGAGRAQLWMRVDRPPAVPGAQPRMGFFDNMSDRPITSMQWTEHRIVGDVAPDAANICIGMMLIGGGGGGGGGPSVRAMIDSARFEVVGDAGPGDAPPAPLTARGLANLIAFARLYGYVRFFHPSDQAALPAADWDAIAITGIRAVEPAQTADELAVALQDTFRPYAPTLRVQAKPFTQPFDLRAASAAGGEVQGEEPREIIAWLHAGIVAAPDQPQRPNVYSSRRLTLPRTDPDVEEKAPAPGATAPAELGGGVFCSLPIVLYVADGKTLPLAPAPSRPRDALPQGWSPSGDDRTTRLADVVIAWNILQHSYPYFDVVKANWRSELATALNAAATDADAAAFHTTLRRLIAQLHDGHGGVVSAVDARPNILPLAWDWIENQLVVTRSGDDSVKPGDIVVSIDGEPAGRRLAAAKELVSGATDGWITYRALDDLRRSASREPAKLELRDASGATRAVTLASASGTEPVRDSRPEKTAQLKPGIWYVDIDRINDKDFQAALPDLTKASGIVFDLRGYPRNLGTVVLSHLIDEPITCARWNVPLFTRPDQQAVRWRFSNWPVNPAAPRLTAKVAFITAGSAISYAETYMGMVEHYKIAEIVGQPTAGTNGNVNSFTLPGNYTVMFTGMKVLKHDQSQHHGIGIRPTVPVERTIKGAAEGRDELLEKAVEVVGG